MIVTWSTEKFHEYLSYFLVFLLPWQTRWIFHDPGLFGETWEYGRLSLYGWDIILLILAIWLWPKLKSELKYIFRVGRAFYFYLLLLSLAFFSGAWATDAILVTYWGWRLLEGGILWLLVRAIKPKLRFILWSLVAAGVIQAVWGLCQFSTQIILANKWLGVAAHPVTQGGTSVLLNEGGRWLRAYGGQVHPNVLGGLLVFTVLATAWLYIKSKIQNPNIQVNSKFQSRQIFYSYSLLSLFVVQLIGLFVTFSRAAWLALFITLVFFWYQMRDNRLVALAPVLIAAVIFVIMGAALWQPTKARLIGSSASQLEKQAIEERVTGIGESKSLLESAWWRGVGLGNYTKALASHQPGLHAYYYQPVHNIFLLILTELGLAGLALWFLFICHRFRDHSKQWLLFLTPVAVAVFFDHYWWTSASMMLLFWLIVALPDSDQEDKA